MIKKKYIGIISLWLIFNTISPLLLNGQDYTEDEPDSLVVNKYLHLGATTGFIQYFGELDNDINLPASERLGVNLFFNYGISPSFTLGVGFLNGRLFGQIRSDSTDALFTNINFKSSVFAPQVRLTYNAGGLYRYNIPKVFQPWAYTGLEWIFFNPLGDLTTSDGMPYYYWKDGYIRDLPESPDNLDKAKFLQRDYFYETYLRDADLDGFGNYPLYAFSIPLGLGLDINLSQSLALTLGASYHLTFTDYLDNITSRSGELDPTRAIGNKRNDSFVFIQAGLTFKYYDIHEIRRERHPVPSVQLPDDFIPFDTNNDGIIQRGEVLKAINDIFNEESEFDPEIVELLVDFFNIQQLPGEKIQY